MDSLQDLQAQLKQIQTRREGYVKTLEQIDQDIRNKEQQISQAEQGQPDRVANVSNLVEEVKQKQGEDYNGPATVIAEGKVLKAGETPKEGALVFKTENPANTAPAKNATGTAKSPKK